MNIGHVSLCEECGICSRLGIWHRMRSHLSLECMPTESSVLNLLYLIKLPIIILHSVEACTFGLMPKMGVGTQKWGHSSFPAQTGGSVESTWAPAVVLFSASSLGMSRQHHIVGRRRMDRSQVLQCTSSLGVSGQHCTLARKWWNEVRNGCVSSILNVRAPEISVLQVFSATTLLGDVQWNNFLRWFSMKQLVPSFRVNKDYKPWKAERGSSWGEVSLAEV